MNKPENPFNLYKLVEAANIQELIILSNNEDEKIRTAVAGDGKLSENLFLKLAQDSSAGVRCALVSRMDTPHNILMMLIDDPEWEVRWGVANCNNSTIEILEKLLDDSHEAVRHDAQEHIDHLKGKV